MAKPQTKEDKERFFSNLERLCESDSDLEVDGTTKVQSSRDLLTNEIGLRSLRVSEQLEGQIKEPRLRAPDTSDLVQGPRSDKDIAAACTKVLSSTASRQETILPKQHTPTLTSLTSKKRTRSSRLETSTTSIAKKVKGETPTGPREKRIFEDLVFCT